MHHGDVLTSERVACEARAESRKHALELLSELLAHSPTHLSPAEIYRILNEREMLGSTCLGQGAALPHGNDPELTEPVAAMLVLEEPIDFDSGDKGPVQTVVGLLLPAGEDRSLLTRFRSILKDPGRLRQLQDCEDADALVRVVNGWVDDADTTPAAG